MTQKNGNSPVLMVKVHAGTKYIAQNLLLVAQSSSVERWGAMGLVLSLRWNMGTQLGMGQPRARLAGNFPASKSHSLSYPSPAGSEGIKGNRSRNSSPAMSRKLSVVFWSGPPCEQLEASSPPSEESAPFGYAEKTVVLDDASGPWEPGELAVTSTCPLNNVTSTPEGESVCCGTTGFTKSGLTSVVGHGFAAEWSQKRARFAERPSGLLGMFCLVNSRNLVFSSLAITMQVSTPRSQVFLCLRLVEQVISSGPLRNASNTPGSSGEPHGTETRQPVISSFSAEVTVPSTCPLNNATNTHGSSGEWHGIITATHTAQRMSSAIPVPFVPLKSSWCHGLRTSTERNGSVRRAGANPKLSKEFYVKRNVNSWPNLKSVMMPQRPF